MSNKTITPVVGMVLESTKEWTITEINDGIVSIVSNDGIGWGFQSKNFDKQISDGSLKVKQGWIEGAPVEQGYYWINVENHKEAQLAVLKKDKQLKVGFGIFIINGFSDVNRFCYIASQFIISHQPIIKPNMP